MLVHLFAGEHKWRCSGPVVEVEKSRGSDLLQEGVWQHLLSWAISGAIGGLVAGPPCRTVSACRSEWDGGPPPVRGRDENRWGLPDIPGHLQELVVGDNVLWLRTVFLYAVAQAAADGAYSPSVETGGGCTDRNPPVPVSPPQHVQDPIALAKWAISVASSRLSQSRAEEPSGWSQDGPRLFFVWEHPRDPKEYMPGHSEPSHGWPSWWAFPEWIWFRDEYGLHEAEFDQGKLGHSRPKPTTVATSSWFLFEALHARFLDSEERRQFVADIQGRVRASATWARWAPGLTDLVLQSWKKWGAEQGLWPEVQDRQRYLAKLTQEEQLRRHQQNDHVPFRKGCPICVAAQGRQRSHWRASFTGIYALSADIAGPFKPGRCWDPTASGRDRGLGYRYFLATAFTFPLEKPVDASGEGPMDDKTGVPASSAPVQAPSEPDELSELPEWRELFGEPEDGSLDSMVRELSPALKVVERRFRSKASEPVFGPEPPLPPPATAPPAKGCRTLFLGVPLRTRRGKEVLGAIQQTVNRLQAYGFPVHRFHADRAKELRSAELVAWLRAMGIHGTWTAGESPAGNKAELAVQNLKGASRKLLEVSGLPHAFWPFAVLHASNRNWVHLAEGMGAPVLALLPFGLALHARKRLKHADKSSWSPRTVMGRYLGQAPHTPGGHLVWVEQSPAPKVLLTNTVYPVGPRSSDYVKPKRRLTFKTSPEFVLKSVTAHVILGPGSGLSSLVFPRAARFSPGGEWESGDGSTSDFWDVWDFSIAEKLDTSSTECSALQQLRGGRPQDGR